MSEGQPATKAEKEPNETEEAVELPTREAMSLVDLSGGPAPPPPEPWPVESDVPAGKLPPRM